MLAERVDDDGVRIRHQEHVGLLDLLEAPDRGTVEPESVDETRLGQLVRRHREVLHEAGKIAETKVDDLDPFVSHEPDDLGSSAVLHVILPFAGTARRRRGTLCASVSQGASQPPVSLS